MSAWWFIFYLLLAGIALLFVISMPVPCTGRLELTFDKFRRGLVQKVLGMSVLMCGAKSIRLIDVIFVFSTLLFVLELMDVDRDVDSMPGKHSVFETCSKFRRQRNFWIAAFNLSIYYCLARYTSLLERNISLRETLEKSTKSE